MVSDTPIGERCANYRRIFPTVTYDAGASVTVGVTLVIAGTMTSAEWRGRLYSRCLPAALATLLLHPHQAGCLSHLLTQIDSNSSQCKSADPVSLLNIIVFSNYTCADAADGVKTGGIDGDEAGSAAGSAAVRCHRVKSSQQRGGLGPEGGRQPRRRPLIDSAEVVMSSKMRGAPAAPAGRPSEATGAWERGPLGASEVEMSRRTRAPRKGWGGEGP